MKENDVKQIRTPNKRGINALGVLKLPLFLMTVALLAGLNNHPIISAIFAAASLFHIVVISVPSFISSMCTSYTKECKYKEAENWSNFGLRWCRFLKLGGTGILPRSFSWDCLFVSTLIQSYIQQSRFEEALNESKGLKTLLEKAQDLDGAADAGGQMAFCLIAMGRLTEAENILDRTIPFLENALRHLADEDEIAASTYRARLCSALFEKATLYETKRDFITAEKIRRQALREAEIFSQNDDESAIMTHICMLANCLYQLKKLDEAEKLARQVFEYRKNNLKPDHVLLSSAKQCLGRILCQNDNLSEAQPLLESALINAVKSVGENHPDIAGYKCELAKLRIKQNKLADAEKLLLEAIEQTEKIQGKDHPNVIEYYLAISELKDKEHKTDQATEAKQHAERILNNLKG